MILGSSYLFKGLVIIYVMGGWLNMGKLWNILSAILWRQIIFTSAPFCISLRCWYILDN